MSTTMSTTNLPQDPVMLLSFVNTHLRDFYQNLEDFCLSFQIDEKELTNKLLSIDYTYDPAVNQFV